MPLLAILSCRRYHVVSGGMVSIAISLSSCGSGVQSAQVAKFGAAATNTVSLVAEAGRLENDLSVAYATEDNACLYLKSSRYTIAPPRANAPILRLQERDAFLKALSGYAKALATATDPDAVANLKAAAAKLTASAARLSTAAAVASPGAAVVAPVFKLAVDSGVYMSEQDRLRRIQEIAKEVQPYLNDATVLVFNEYRDDQKLIKKRMMQWEAAARCNLAHFRKTGVAAYQQYATIDKAKRDFQDRSRIVGESIELMTRLLEAHQDLADGSKNFADAITDINLFLDDIADLKKAIAANKAT